ncbi:MAG: GNAT family N-acetyltransferase [Lachnospiraceae bacterium]
MQIEALSSKYRVKKLAEAEVAEVYALCKENPLYYNYCPPFVTPDSIRADMAALPKGKTVKDKYFIGFYDGPELVAVMDLILKYPNEETAFIGFFMMNAKRQGRGIGTAIIEEVCRYLSSIGFPYMRLCYVKGNPQSEHFWLKTGFEKTGLEVEKERYTVVVMEKN